MLGGAAQYTLAGTVKAPLMWQLVPAVTLMLGVAYVVINTTVDILQAVADPRVNA